MTIIPPQQSHKSNSSYNAMLSGQGGGGGSCPHYLWQVAGSHEEKIDSYLVTADICV